MKQKRFSDGLGLRLSRQALRVLKAARRISGRNLGTYSQERVRRMR